jgi:hypothetical protein
MRRLPAALLVLGILAAGPAAGQTNPGQTNPGQTNPGPLQVTAAAGVGGFVDSRDPTVMAITISSDILFVGSVEIRHGATLMLVPVEIPAGTEKTYQVLVPPPIGSSQVRLRLLAEGATDPSFSLTVPWRAPTDQTLVAVVGPAEMVATIDEARVAVTGEDVIAAAVGTADLERGPTPARYLVLSEPVPVPAATHSWLKGGGRLVVDRAYLDQLGLDLGAPVAGDGFTGFRFGEGWVLAGDLEALGPSEWSRLIRPLPMELAPRDVWQTPDPQMMTAATNGGDQGVPRLPWLLGAMVVYALVVGPVNFLVLRRLRRRELAWMTIPAISVVALAGFWVAGRQRLETTLVNHATLIVAGEQPVVRTAIALAAGAGGRITVAVPQGWEAYPSSLNADGGGMMPLAESPALVTGPGEFQFRVDQLGGLGIHARRPLDPSQVPEVESSFRDGRVEVTVTNTTPFEFFAWGIVAQGRVVVAPAGLAPGESAAESLVPGRGDFNELSSVGDAVIQQRQLWNDPTAWNRLSSLGATAAFVLPGGNSFFFGFSDKLTVPISVDGQIKEARGTTLVVEPLAAAGGVRMAVSRLIDPGAASWVDWGPGYLQVATGQMTVGWTVEDGPDPSLAVSNVFGELPRLIEAYNWRTAAFDVVERGGRLDLDRYRSPLGEVLVRASANAEDNPNQIAELSMSPYGFALEWPS